MRSKNLNRRDFFGKAGQMTLFSVLLGGSAYLLAKDRVQLYGCSNDQFCKNCEKLKGCSLEQAKKERGK